MCGIINLITLSLIFVCNIDCKYVEGVLKTRENWAFLARFCFLSDEGQFEYEIEFNEDQGEPNLLLYYDTNDQWPAVYKTSKTCEQKEAVLSIIKKQIVNLTTHPYSYRDSPGCSFLHYQVTTPSPIYTLNVKSLPPRKTTTKTGGAKNTSKTTPASATVTTEEIPSTTDYSSTFTSLTLPTSFEGASSTATTLGHYSKDDLLSETTWATSDLTSTANDATTEDKEYVTTETSKGTVIRKRSLPMSKSDSQRIIRSGRTVFCHHARRFESARERWWFIAISNCKGSKGIDIKYKFLMTNGPPGDYWHEHFSADEFYILPILMAFSIAYSFLMLGIVMCSMELKSRQLLHTTYKIFVFSVVLQLFGILFESVSYLKYAVHGTPAAKVKRLGAMLMGASETSFLLLLLLLAKGFTITRGRLPLRASIKLTIFMCLYVVTYLSIFVYEGGVFDPGEVLYLYESPAGYALIILRIVAWCMFIYSTIFTLKRYPEKDNFYYPFNIFGTVWFVAGPAFILSANTYIDKWVRESVVCGALLFISFGGHLMFLILTMPSVANKNFPYHVRTTQIGIMELTGNAGASTIEQFSHHVYEPSTTIREQTVIIPLTRRTEEIFEGMYNQRTFSRNNVPNDHANEQHQNNARDVALDNVLNWSLAKNLPALELPNFERIHNRSSTTSANSRMTNASDPNNVLSRSPSVRQGENEAPANNLDDYIRDVPIELFTVSKMVVTTNNLAKANIREEHDE